MKQMTKVLTFSNHKGGVGKTTSAANVGAGLSYLEKRVLLIDMDPQSNLSQSLGVENPEISIYDCLKGDSPLVPVNIKPNLDLMPSSLDLSGAEIELSTEPGREYILRELIEPLKDRYDYIIIDCPPSLGLLTINSLVASNEVYIPLQAEYLAMKGLTKITEVIDKIQKRLNKDLKLGGVFLTQFDSRKILNRDVASTIMDFFGEKVFATKIRDNVALAEAPTKGLDIFRYDPKCFGAQDYLGLCLEIIEKDNDDE